MNEQRNVQVGQKKVIKPAVLGILAVIPGLLHAMIAVVAVSAAMNKLMGKEMGMVGVVFCGWGVLVTVLLGCVVAIVGTVTSFIGTAAKATKVCGQVVSSTAWYNWIVVVALGAVCVCSGCVDKIWVTLFGAFAALFLTFAGRSLKKACGLCNK